MRFLKNSLVLAALLVAPVLHGGVARGYEPPVEELIQRALPTQSRISRLIISFRSMVYDPLGGKKDEQGKEDRQGGGGQQSAVAKAVAEDGATAQPERAFLQKVYWVRGVVTAVETFSTEGELLHFYFEEGFDPVSVSLSPERPFSDWDVVPPFLPFLSSNRSVWLEGLTRWGVDPNSVRLERTPKGATYYRLADGSQTYALVQRDGYRVKRIMAEIQGGERPRRMSVEFSEFVIYGNKEKELQGLFFPRTTDFLLDGRLFRQSIVTSMQVDPSWRNFPLSRLRNQAKEHVTGGSVFMNSETAR